MGEVQQALGIQTASSFILQVKNPLAPTQPGAGRTSGKAEFSKDIMENLFGKGGKGGRESYGRRFISADPATLLDYEGCELLLIASRSGQKGIEAHVGKEDGQGECSPYCRR